MIIFLHDRGAFYCTSRLLEKRLSICVQTLYIRQNASVIIALNLWLCNANKHKHFFKGENICACLY